MQPVAFASLYEAQRGGIESIDKFQFVRYSQDEILAEPWQIKRAGMGVYNVVMLNYNNLYNVGSDLYYFIDHGVSRIHNYILEFLRRNEILACGIDCIYPEKRINRQRYFAPFYLPKVIEQMLGYLVYVLETVGMTRTSEHLQSEQVISKKGKCKEILRALENSNKDLLEINENNPFKYKVHVLDSRYIDALAAPGGQIVIFSKIIQEIENELTKADRMQTMIVRSSNGQTQKVDVSQVTLDDILAALIGHEITHIASRHSSLYTAYEVFSSILLSALSFDERVRWLAMQVNDLVSSILFRSNEYEADITGMYLAQKAGYNPLGALYLQEIMKKTQGKAVNLMHEHFEFLATHPCGEKRKCAIYTAYQILVSQEAVQVVEAFELD